jgi:hypothetical protein
LARWTPEQLELRDGVLVADHEQAFEATSLLGSELSGEEAPEAALSTVAGPGAQSLQDAEAGQEHLVLNQPAGGQVDQLGGGSSDVQQRPHSQRRKATWAAPDPNTL